MSTTQKEGELSASRSAALAEQLTSRNYNWDLLAKYFGEINPPSRLSDAVTTVCFELSYVLIEHPEYITGDTGCALN